MVCVVYLNIYDYFQAGSCITTEIAYVYEMVSQFYIYDNSRFNYIVSWVLCLSSEESWNSEKLSAFDTYLFGFVCKIKSAHINIIDKKAGLYWD